MRFVGISAGCLLVAGCGGGGGGVNSTPTPTPPPAPPPNTSLLNLSSSESFANDAATGSASFPKDGTKATVSASQTSLAASYDTAAKGYTITVGGRSQTFLPSNLDTTQSTARIAVYVKKSGGTTDSLTLTKPGTSGRFNYEFVGGGYWQRTIDGTSTISGSLDAFDYGFRTPDAGVPRTGRGEYAVDLLGAETTSDNVFGVTGQGTTQVDFASGAIVTHGTLTAAIDGATTFSSEAKLSSTTGAFSGNFRFNDFGLFSGQLNGSFFGPNGQEIGAAFSASEPSGRVAVGTIIGRGASVTASNASLVSPANNEFFTNDAAAITATLDGTSGAFSAQTQGQASLIVNFDATRQKYTIIASDRSQYFGPSTSVTSGTTSDLLSFTAPTGFQFVRGGQWRRAAGVGNLSQYSFDNFAYGVETPDAALPRTGTAGFAVQISGAAADGDYQNVIDFTGQGTLTADLATGIMSTSGGVDYVEDTPFAPRGAKGSFTGNANISSSANSFSGTFSMAGIGSYNGTLNGRFYGPAGQEMGGAFALSDGAGGVVAGSFLGKNDPNVLAARDGLLSLTQPIAFDTAYLLFKPGAAPFTSKASTLALDPTSHIYSFSATGDGIVAADVSFGPGDIVSAQSDAIYTRYAVTSPTKSVAATLFNPGPANTALALTYTSFADITLTVANNGSNYVTQYYYPFGVETPSVQLPRFGTGDYSGIIYGRGSVIDPVGVQHRYALQGTSALSMDFGNSTFSSDLDIAGIDNATSALVNFGIHTATGTLGSNNILSGSFASDITGLFRGNFFGANAAEFGAVFSINKTAVDGTRTSLNGLTVGKHN